MDVPMAIFARFTKRTSSLDATATCSTMEAPMVVDLVNIVASHANLPQTTLVASMMNSCVTAAHMETDTPVPTQMVMEKLM